MSDVGLRDGAPQIDQRDRHGRSDKPDQEDSLGALECVGGAGEPVDVHLPRVAERGALRTPSILLTECVRSRDQTRAAQVVRASLGDRRAQRLVV